MRDFEKSIGYALLTVLVFMQGSATRAETAGSCPSLGENQRLLQEGEKYVKQHPFVPSAPTDKVPASKTGQAPGAQHLPAEIAPTASDVTVRSADYLTSPILNTEDIKRARQQADKLSSAGQTALSKRIRARVDDSIKELFGQATTNRQLECIAVAERLQEVAWAMEKRNDLANAQKYYSKVVAIYSTELGDKPKTANALGQLARVMAARKDNKNASSNYARALSVYNRYPNFADADMASVLECYAHFMEQSGRTSASKSVFKRAADARTRLYGR